MKQSRLLTLAAGLMLLTLSSCSEIAQPTPLTYSQLLTGKEKKTWNLVSFEVIDEGEGSGVVPINNIIRNSCEADDQFVFYANAERRFEYTNGPTKCSSKEPDVLLTDTWTLTNATATLDFALPLLGSQPLPFTVKELTETSMTVELYFEKVQEPKIDASYRFVFSSSTK